MCGRFTLAAEPEELAEALGIDPAAAAAVPPRYNIAPTQPVAAVRAAPDGAGRRLDLLRWGIAPARGRGAGLIINARAETLAARPLFREALGRGRCLVPADGFYEWKRSGRARQPYHLRRPDRGPIAFAGLWLARAGPQGEDACAIVTVPANDVVRPIHDRMPAILAPSDYDPWLAPDPRGPSRAGLLRPAPGEWLVAVPVSRRVNRADAEGPDLIRPIDPQPTLF